MTTLELRVLCDSDADSAGATRALAEKLTAVPELDVTTGKEPHTQDLIGFVTIVLSAPAVVVLAKSVADVIRRYGVREIEISNGKKKVKIKNARNTDIDELIKIFRQT